MGAILWFSCIGLGLVFGVAGIAKLRDPEGSLEAFTQLGIPPGLASKAKTILPVVELAVAATLFVPWSATVGAAMAAVLLCVFSVIVAVRLFRGEHPSCSCFGRLGTGRIGSGTLVRNGVLVVFAALVAVKGWGHAERLSPTALTRGDWIGFVIGVLLAAVVIQGWLLVKLMRRHGRLLVRIDKFVDSLGPTTAGTALPVGTRAPDFRLTGAYGETAALGSLLAPGRPLLLMFTDPGCGPCATLMPDAARWQRELGASMTVALITRGDAATNRAKATEHGLVNVLIQDDHEVGTAYASPGTPSAVLIGTDGTILTALVAGAEAIRRLVEEATEQTIPGGDARADATGSGYRAIDASDESATSGWRVTR